MCFWGGIAPGLCAFLLLLLNGCATTVDGTQQTIALAVSPPVPRTASTALEVRIVTKAVHAATSDIAPPEKSPARSSRIEPTGVPHKSRRDPLPDLARYDDFILGRS